MPSLFWRYVGEAYDASACMRHRKLPASLFIVSMYSSSSTLSCTMPPPACRYAVLSLNVIVRMAMHTSKSCLA